MTTDTKINIAFITAIAIVIVVLTSVITDEIVSDTFQRDAVTKGYAHWEPNPADGRPVFKWNN